MNDMPTSKFCQSCGTQLAAGAAFCANCGSPAGSIPAPAAPPVASAAPPQYQPQAYGPRGKSKTTAVVLAVFLGFWSWLYTFQVNKVKFFIGLGAGVVSSVIQISSAIVNADSNEWYQACINDVIYGSTTLDECLQYQPDQTGTFVALFISFGVWLWPLIDNARKPASFYQAYPNVK
jgi:hypothetical protein